MSRRIFACWLVICALIPTSASAQNPNSDCSLVGPMTVACGTIAMYTGGIPQAVNPFSSTFTLLSNTSGAMIVGPTGCTNVMSCSVNVAVGHFGSFVIKVTHTTQSGAMVMCSIPVTVTDTTPPVITCPPDVKLACNAPTDPGSTGMPTATDCGPVTFTHSDAAGATNCAGTAIVRTWTATDLAGNTSTCVQTITFHDLVPPSIQCPPDVTVSCDSEVPPPNTGSVVVSDDCGGAVAVTHVNDVPVGSCPKTITRTYQAMDPCGNTSMCSQIITVDDTTPPVITCPPDVSVPGVGSGCIVVDIGIATATDNCTGMVTVTNNAPVLFCVGTTSVIWTATDACGNTATCKQNVTVGGGLCATKFYDSNANGVQDPGEPGIPGWEIVVTGTASFSGTTDATGSVCFPAGAGTYDVTEGTPNEPNWVHTTPTTQTVTISAASPSASVTFGNYCSDAPSGGHTLGFWRNPNGKAILQAHDPEWRNILNALNLRNANGTDFTVPAGAFAPAFNAFKAWLQAANATNMAYMLSAQLAANTLSVNYSGLDDSANVVVPGGLSGAGVCIVPFLSVVQPITCGAPPLLALTAVPGSMACGCTSNNGLATVGAIRARADCLLGAYPVTNSSGLPRTYEEAVKDLLDILNNNGGGGYACGSGIHFIHDPSEGICPHTFGGK